MSGEALPADDITYSERGAPVLGLKGQAPMIAIGLPPKDRAALPRLRRDIMHPMFKELFIDADAPAAEDDRRRRARRSRRAMITRPAARNRENRPRP